MNRDQINAYAAGLIDGEGCISIGKHVNKSGTVYYCRIDVGMSAKALTVLNWLKSNFGGNIRKSRKGTKEWEEAFAWGIFGKQAHQFLLQIQPYLVLKHEQARLAIRIQEMIAELSNGWTKEAHQRGKAICARMQELNCKGPGSKDIPVNGWFARLVGGTWVTPQMSMFSDLGWEEYFEGLAKAGYGHIQWICLRASDFGAPHQRERIFIVAHPSISGRQERDMPRVAEDPRHTARCNVAYSAACRLEKQPYTSGSYDELDAPGERQSESRLGRESHGFSSRLDRPVRWPAGPGEHQHNWEPPRVVIGKQPDRAKRLKALGNAIVPQCVQYVAEQVLKSLEEAV